MDHRRWTAALVIAMLSLPLGLGSAGAQPLDLSPVDCEAPAPHPEPGTGEWRARDALNMYCSEERKIDQSTHPVFALPVPQPAGRRLSDAYRAPDRHDNVRFRFQSTTIGSYATEIYLPCSNEPEVCPDLPEGLERFDPPYPVVISIHGGLSRKELHWWSSQPLAERGYVVVAPDGGTAPNLAVGQAMLSWVLEQEQIEFDLDRIGIAGHSLGAGVATTLGQGSDDISAVIAWDGGGNMGDAQTPQMFQVADYTTWPGYPVPYTQPPNPIRGAGYATLREAGTDTMRVVGRATTHIDWTGGAIWGNRYGEAMWAYYNLAWFDRYLQGKLTGTEDTAERAWREQMANDAHRRLVADTFDDSADGHNLSQGFWDPVQAATSGDPLYGGNVPYTLDGKPVVDKLSFYYLSSCFVTDPSTGERVDAGDRRSEGC